MIRIHGYLRRRLQGDGESGITMIIAIIILFALLGIGTALLSTANGQQRSSYNQQSSESAYSLAEAALNAQVYALSTGWPTSSYSSSYPTSCNASSNGASYCPSTSDLSAKYPANSAGCPANSVSDAWSTSSPPPTTGWTTYVRDAGSGSSTQDYFNSAAEKTSSSYDASGDGYVWVRAVGFYDCHMAVVVSRVSEQVVTVPFPSDVLNANSFHTTDRGSNKTILNTQGPSSSSSPISVRCDGTGSSASTSGSGNCTSFTTGQVNPTVSYANPPAGSSTLSAGQLRQIIALAKADNTYFGPGVCPTTMSQLQGNPVYIDGTGCGTISISGNTIANSASSPGFLVIDNATISFTGTGTYYGVIYDANAMGSSGDVVSLGGDVTIVGGITVDGEGGVSLGSSGNGPPGITAGCTAGGKCGDLVYDASAFGGLHAFGGAAVTPNTFRQLPATQ